MECALEEEGFKNKGGPQTGGKMSVLLRWPGGPVGTMCEADVYYETSEGFLDEMSCLWGYDEVRIDDTS